MKRGLFLVSMLLFVIGVLGNPVDSEKAYRVARNFLLQKGADVKNIDIVDVTDKTPFHELFVFSNRATTGFVIVAADDRVVPVLGYSLNAVFDAKNIPINALEWLQGYEVEIAHLRAAAVIASAEIVSMWDGLLRGVAETASLATAVSPLIATTWNQTQYYNDKCPFNSTYNQHTTAGCTAVATAQVMRYWGHPATGRGSHSYNLPYYGTQSANFAATNYDWNNMPLMLNASSTTAEIDAVSTLLYHVGVSINMNYGVSALGGSAGESISDGTLTYPSAENALREYFDYSSTLYGARKSAFNDAEWCALLRKDLDAGRPIIYTGYDPSSGHCFVCDGYDNNNRFHFNWGWSGVGDGYFMIGALNPSSTGTGTTATSTFNLDNSAILGIVPAVGSGNSSVVSASANPSLQGSVSGGGTYANGAVVTLDVTANRGYCFKDWSDGCRQNHRQFLANGNVNLFANIVPAVGDTINYCYNGYTSNLSWRYCALFVNSADLPTGRQLKSVQLFNHVEGDYVVRVYRGDTYSPGIMVYSEQFHLSGTQRWETLHFRNAVPIDNTANLWVVFYCNNASFPIPLTTYCGNGDGSWFSPDGSTWVQYNDISCMVRAIFSNPTDVVVNAIAADTSQGTVLGSGIYSIGETATLTAIPLGDNVFDHWNDGSTENPRTVSVSAAATYTAYFSSCGINSLPVVLNFSQELGCWTTYCADHTNDDGFGIMRLNNGDSVFSFCSYYRASDYNQYLISPRLNVPNALHLAWDYRPVYGSSESYRVVYSTTDNTPSSFTHVLYDTITFGSTWSHFEVDIPTEAKYIAFHYYSTHLYYIYFDNIVLTGAPLPQHTVSVFSNNESMGEVSGSGQYEEGSAVTIAATPAHCYQFLRWQDGNTDNPRQIVVGATDATYTAYFANVVAYGSETYQACDSMSWRGTTYYNSIDNIQLDTLTPDGCDSVIHISLVIGHSNGIDTTVVAYGSFVWEGVTYTASTEVSHTYTNLSQCDSVVTLHLTILDLPTTYTITAEASDTTMGYVEGGGVYEADATVTLTATSYLGYVFVKWNDECRENPYLFSATADAHYIAIFEPLQAVNEADGISQLWYADGILHIEGAQGKSVCVYDVLGRLIVRFKVEQFCEQRSIALPKVSFVKVGSESVRKIVSVNHP